MKVGDKVEVIKYGHIVWLNKKLNTHIVVDNIYFENDNFYFVDLNPSLIGKIGVIKEKLNNQFSLSGIPEKIAWYNQSQLKVIK